MKRGTSWGPGVSQFPGLQTRLDCGVEAQELGPRAAENPPGLQCWHHPQWASSFPALCSVCPTPTPTFPSSSLCVCAGPLLLTDVAAWQLHSPLGLCPHLLSGPLPQLPAQFTPYFPVQGRLPTLPGPLPQLPVVRPQLSCSQWRLDGHFPFTQRVSNLVSGPIMLLEITEDPKEFLFMGLCLLIFTTFEMKLRNHKIFILEEQRE